MVWLIYWGPNAAKSSFCFTKVKGFIDINLSFRKLLMEDIVPHV